MNIFKDTDEYPVRLHAYRPGIITVNKTEYTETILVMPEQYLVGWGPASISQLQKSDFEKILAFDPQIVLIGSGSKFEYLSPTLYENLTNKKIGVEVMDTAAACRTFMLIMGEGRRVVGLLFC